MGPWLVISERRSPDEFSLLELARHCGRNCAYRVPASRADAHSPSPDGSPADPNADRDADPGASSRDSSPHTIAHSHTLTISDTNSSCDAHARPDTDHGADVYTDPDPHTGADPHVGTDTHAAAFTITMAKPTSLETQVRPPTLPDVSRVGYLPELFAAICAARACSALRASM